LTLTALTSGKTAVTTSSEREYPDPELQSAGHPF
jgi:hypothetical protein